MLGLRQRAINGNAKPTGLLARSWGEPGVVADGLQGLVHGQPLVQRHPLTGVPHEVQVEAAPTSRPEAGEAGLEAGREGVGPWASVDGDQEQGRTVPLQRDVADVVEAGVLRRRLDVPRRPARVEQCGGMDEDGRSGPDEGREGERRVGRAR
jgi:hypothetical protein